MDLGALDGEVPKTVPLAWSIGPGAFRAGDGDDGAGGELRALAHAMRGGEHVPGTHLRRAATVSNQQRRRELLWARRASADEIGIVAVCRLTACSEGEDRNERGCSDQES